MSDAWIYLFIQVPSSLFSPVLLASPDSFSCLRRGIFFSACCLLHGLINTRPKYIHGRYVLWPHLCIYWQRTAAVWQSPWSAVIPIIKHDLRKEHLGGSAIDYEPSRSFEYIARDRKVKKKKERESKGKEKIVSTLRISAFTSESIISSRQLLKYLNYDGSLHDWTIAH